MTGGPLKPVVGLSGEVRRHRVPAHLESEWTARNANEPQGDRPAWSSPTQAKSTLEWAHPCLRLPFKTSLTDITTRFREHCAADRAVECRKKPRVPISRVFCEKWE